MHIVLRWPSLESTAFAALRHRNYRLWFFGQMVSVVGTWIQSVAQGWLVYHITGSDLALGTISLLGSLPTLFLMLPAGAVCDRVSKHKILMLTQTMMMLCALALTILTATGRVAIWHIGALALVLGVTQSFDAPARQSLAIEMVDERSDLPSAIALNSMMFNMARVIGPAVGGVVLASLGAVWCFALNSLSFLAVLIALVHMRLPKQAIYTVRQPMLKEISIGIRFVLHSVEIRSIMLVVASATIFGMTYSVLLPAVAADVLKAGEKGLGYLSTAVGIGALVAALIVASSSYKPWKGWLLIIGNLSMPLGLLLFASSRSLPLALAVLVLVGWANVTQNATANTLIQLLTQDDIRGRVMSVYTMVLFGGGPFNSLQAGLLGEAFGPSIAISIGALIMLAMGITVICCTPRLRRLLGQRELSPIASQQPPQQERE